MTVDSMCGPDLPMTTQFELFGPGFAEFVLPYQCAIATLTTKVHILRQGFTHLDRHCPIEHVSARVKSPDSVMAKAQRLRCPLTAADIRQNIRDIAGVRITCGLISDTYRVADLIGGQPDVTVFEVEDYISKPKSNGYKSLHVAVEIPVFLSDRVVQVPVELQIRTIAMDFWASLEHKIYYKYQRSVLRRLLQELTEAADVAHRLDRKMERLHNEVAGLKSPVDSDDGPLRLGAIDHEHGDRSQNRCGKPHNSTAGPLVRYPPADGVDVCRNTTHLTDPVLLGNTRE
ncbi:hypothetical protein CBI38_31020 (plasmid) [Rhodococcus oxybenzonivorans]|uniref:RelA/SpoT domain-containing protein n=1 Tax=Rhodococcus oxybenzonivorans TaxID=1990687 RepID=A0A2S2C566_9NOCA|nr:GTP pyrophosphokinase family protein [Rhodococcus oxybenzonivorans]AWK76020.1 hypothetical protein CBI38_31020 [Rhodococcus oxybenzonivorans]